MGSNPGIDVHLDVHGLERRPKYPQFSNWVGMHLQKPIFHMLKRYFHFRWEAGAYTAVSFYVPDNWKAGRIWVCRNFGKGVLTRIH